MPHSRHGNVEQREATNAITRRDVLRVSGGAAILISGIAQAAGKPRSTIVETTNGKVRGTVAGGVEAYLGIPFGGDTGGRNRFRPAPPAAKWAGVLDAAAYGPGFPQASPFGAQFAPMATSENALNLNVWTPSAGRSGKRPVLVWIFGGGFVAGSGTDPEYDGTWLAHRGDVVVVTFNYRVGALGGLYLGGLSPDYTAGNMMFHDQVMALQWVRDNIEAFGGDPGNVTIFGQSAGGHSCGDLLAVPQAKGLFHKCSPQSGADYRAHTRAEAEEFTDRFLHQLGIASSNWRALFDVPAAEIVAKQGFMGSVTAAWRQAFATLSTRPMIDGITLASQPHQAVAAGSAEGIPLLVGCNEFELAAWARAAPAQLTPKEFREYLGSRPMVAKHADRLADVYGRSGDSGAQQMQNFMRDLVFGIPCTRLAEAQSAASSAPVYSYLWTWQSPVPGMLSAHHMQVPFEFGTIDLPKQAPVIGTGPGRAELAERFGGAMIAFARSGNPAHPGIPDWPVYDPPLRRTMVIDDVWKLESDPMAERRRAWDGIVYGSLSET